MPIDRYVVVDTQGLKDLFEVLGPVQVLVEKSMHYQDRPAGLKVQLEPGLQQLDASQTEQYVRYRHDGKGDIGRIERQQWFVRQVAQKLKDPAVILKIPQLIKLANDYVQTDLTLDEMLRIATFAKDIKSDQVETAMLPGRATTMDGISYWLPDQEAGALVFNRLAGVQSLTISC